MKNKFLGFSALLLLSMHVVSVDASLVDTLLRYKYSLGVVAALAAATGTGYGAYDCNKRETDLLLDEVGWERIEKLHQEVDLLNNPVIQKEVTSTTTTYGGQRPKVARTETHEKHTLNWVSFYKTEVKNRAVREELISLNNRTKFYGLLCGLSLIGGIACLKGAIEELSR